MCQGRFPPNGHVCGRQPAVSGRLWQLRWGGRSSTGPESRRDAERAGAALFAPERGLPHHGGHEQVGRAECCSAVPGHAFTEMAFKAGSQLGRGQAPDASVTGSPSDAIVGKIVLRPSSPLCVKLLLKRSRRGSRKDAFGRQEKDAWRQNDAGGKISPGGNMRYHTIHFSKRAPCLGKRGTLRWDWRHIWPRIVEER